MANGDTPPIDRSYDLATARNLLSQARAKLNSIEPGSELEQLVKRSMSETAELLEAGHSQLALQGSICQRLWTHSGRTLGAVKSFADFGTTLQSKLEGKQIWNPPPLQAGSHD